jgi:phosphoglycolate phosphatase
MPGPIAIFDLDGTLVDSTKQIAQAMELARKNVGLPELPENFIAEQLGKPIRDLIPEIDLDSDALETLILDFRRVLKMSILNQNKVYEGAVEIVNYLRDNGCGIAIATSKPQHLAELVVGNSKLNGLIDIVQGTDAFPPKPNPEVLFRVINRCNTKVAVMIGDRMEDVQSASAASIPSIGIAQSAHSKQSLLTSGATLAYENMFQAFKDASSILSLIKSSS